MYKTFSSYYTRRTPIAYHGYLNVIKSFLTSITSDIRILEIGINKGQTLLPIVQFLTLTGRNFEYDGVDVILDETLSIILSNFTLNKNQRVNPFIETSQKFLSVPHCRYDLILIDGDHNYVTVAEELAKLPDLVLPHTIVICDDYHGKWSEKDLFYGEREGFETIEGLAKRVDGQKRGVKTAVDEFLSVNSSWAKTVIIPGEPIVLYDASKLSVTTNA